MVALMIEGFDKYGTNIPVNLTVQRLVESGDWTSVANAQIVAPLSTTGAAALIQTIGSLVKTLPANYTRLIGGFRFSSSLGQLVYFGLRDAATAQCSLTIETTTGIINFRNGTQIGTILGTGSSIVANSVHYIEFDITLGNSASYTIWLDGVSIISGTGDTTGTANSYANGILFSAPASGSSLIVDDFYLFDSTGSTNNSVLLTNPRVETTFPFLDSAVQFTFGAAILGSGMVRAVTATGSSANNVHIRRLVAPYACTLSSIVMQTSIASTSAQNRAVVYADAGATAAGALLASGPTITGTAAGVPTVLPLTTPLALSAGTAYWIGYQNDTTTNTNTDTEGSVYRFAATYSSGAPASASALTADTNYAIWGILTAGTPANAQMVSKQPAPGPGHYLVDSTVGHEDLYSFGALNVVPNIVHVVAVKALAARSDSGTRTVSMRTKSVDTNSGGSLTGQTPPNTYGWMSSYFPIDPNTGVAWTGIDLNSALSGFRVDG